jgi:RNA-directed DNA polymerase
MPCAGVPTETRLAGVVVPHAAIASRSWLPRLALACVRRFPEPPHAALEMLVGFVAERPELRTHARGTVVRKLVFPAPRMAIVRGRLAGLEIPAVTTIEGLAALLGTSVGALDFLSRPRRGGRAYSHHVTRLVPKRSGGVRVLEVPSLPLRRLQRSILETILSHVPVHPAAHGFVRERSPRTAAVRHVGREVVVRLDLEDFFSSISAARVRGVLAALGHPEGVTRRLVALVTTRATARALASLREIEPASEAGRARRHVLAQRLRMPHLAQGAPSSPTLANLVAFHLDARLDGLAKRFGATYTRYADDLTFSGDAALAQRVGALVAIATRICLDEGFVVRRDKTRVARRHTRQEVLGVVVNARPNLARDRYDLLRAVLHRVAREGWERAEIDGEPLGPSALRGHVAHACTLLSASRAAKLEAMLAAVGEPASRIVRGV